MTATARWQLLKVLFTQILEQPEGSREAWLTQHCADDAPLRADLLQLLAQQRQPAGFLGEDAQALLERIASAAAAEDERLGSTVGAYRLIRELGVGGMGRVYLAERADGQFAHQVALKLVRSEFADSELRRRFLRERDTLARLAHPNIAHLHDGGLSADGTPYFTLEYIEGTPITHWCNEHRCDLRARVRLMLKVCDAVQHAHRNLIVHRDLKPSNIMVTASGEPKLLDFGIAKPLDKDVAAATLTGSDARPMTREYAAPEQVLGEPVTTATDIYSLGVLLYLLLSGRTPYRRAALGQVNIIKAILEDIPESLQSALTRTAPAHPANPNIAAETIAVARSSSVPVLQRSLRGDLDRIVQRALAKMPEARYPAASAMADDLRAYLEGRALSGGTRTYRLRKFVRRHWLPLAAGALLLLVVVGSALSLTWEMTQVERHAQTAAAVKDFVLNLFQKANPNTAQGKQITLRDAVDLGVKRLDRIPPGQTELKAELQVTLGTIYYQLGLHKEALALHTQAFDALTGKAADGVLTAAAERLEATDVATLGDLERAQALADDAVQRLRSTPRTPVRDLARSLSTASWIASRRGDAPRMKQLSDEVYALASQPPADEQLMYLALQQKATLARKNHDLALAADYYRQALALSLKVNGPDEQESIDLGQLLSSTLSLMGAYDAARPYLQAAFDSAQRTFGEDGSRTLRIGQVLGLMEFDSGDVIAAETRYAHLAALAAAHAPRDETVLAEIRLNYAEILIDLGKFEQAEPLLLEVREFLQARNGNDPDEIAETLASLGAVHGAGGKLELAERETREALAALVAAKVDATALIQARLSQIELARGELEAATSSAREARDIAVKLMGERSHDTAFAHYCYGRVLAAIGRGAEAEVEWRAALASYARLLPPDGLHLRSADARLALGESLARRGDARDEALRLLDQALLLRTRTLGAEHPRTIEVRSVLAAAQNSH